MTRALPILALGLFAAACTRATTGEISFLAFLPLVAIGAVVVAAAVVDIARQVVRWATRAPDPSQSDIEAALAARTLENQP